MRPLFDTIRLLRWLRSFVVAAAMLPALAGGQEFGEAQLDQLTAQVALYPDSLLSQVLMASTYPSDVAEAAKWSRAHSEEKGDAAVKLVESQPWDPSVKSLVAFPQVIIMMGEKPDWVKDLGDAFLAQPEDVMDSVQRLRAQAQRAGNLESNQQVVVKVEPAPPAPAAAPQPAAAPAAAAPQQVIVIEPAQPEVVYVPQYNPTQVYGAWAYPAYPPYYVPPPPGYWFSTAVATGIAWGVGVGVANAVWGGFDWHDHDVDINVNRYNNINVNQRLDVNANRVDWNHNVANRRDVPYRGGDATRQGLDRKQQTASREQYRGRDPQRERAQQAMQERGIDQDRSRPSAAGRDAARQPAQGADRSAQRDGAQADRDAQRERSQQADRDAQRQRAQQADRDAQRQRAQQADRDNAFRGVSDQQARAQADRGNASRQAMQQHSRPQVQGGGARPQGGGGGLGHGGGHGGGRLR